MVEFDDRIDRSDEPVLFWGSDRTSTTLAAAAFALRTRRKIAWLEVRDPLGHHEAYEPFLSSVFPPEDRFGTRTPAEMAPQNAAANLASWTLRGDRAAESPTGRLPDFLRLPGPIQEIATNLLASGRRSALLISNVDRTSPFYPRTIPSTRRFLAILRQHGLLVVAIDIGKGRRDRFAFGFVFQVSGGSRGTWRSAELTLEKGDVAPGSAGSVPTRLGDIESVRGLARRGPMPRTQGRLAGVGET